MPQDVLPDYKQKSLLARRAALLEEYEAVNSQFNRALSDLERVRIRRQIEELEQELEDIDRQLGPESTPAPPTSATGKTALPPASAQLSETSHGARGLSKLNITTAGGIAIGVVVVGAIILFAWILASSQGTPQATPSSLTVSGKTPAAVAGPALYDNFNNPANDGIFDSNLWEYWTPPPNQITQRDGLLVVTQKKSYNQTRLLASKHDNITLAAPTFFEAKLMLDSKAHAGVVELYLFANLPGSTGWHSFCSISEGLANCYDSTLNFQEGHDYEAGGQTGDYDKWYTFRIQVDPATMTFAYYIDNQKIGSHVPIDAEGLKKATFKFGVGVSGESETEAITGYIDDVRIGTVEQK